MPEEATTKSGCQRVPASGRCWLYTVQPLIAEAWHVLSEPAASPTSKVRRRLLCPSLREPLAWGPLLRSRSIIVKLILSVPVFFFFFWKDCFLFNCKISFPSLVSCSVQKGKLLKVQEAQRDLYKVVLSLLTRRNILSEMEPYAMYILSEYGNPPVCSSYRNFI